MSGNSSLWAEDDVLVLKYGFHIFLAISHWLSMSPPFESAHAYGYFNQLGELEVILCDFCVWDTGVDTAFPVLAGTLVRGVLSR